MESRKRKRGSDRARCGNYQSLILRRDGLEFVAMKSRAALVLGPDFSVQLRYILDSGNFADFPCKRHQPKLLVFYPVCLASRGPRVRVPPRPAIFSIICGDLGRAPAIQAGALNESSAGISIWFVVTDLRRFQAGPAGELPAKSRLIKCEDLTDLTDLTSTLEKGRMT